MEIFFHISEIYNRHSILKNGLIPSKIKLQHHLDFFKEDNILQKTENKILYFAEDCGKNEKFFKDFVFCKVWIHPRNEIGNIDNFENYSNYENKLFYKYNQMIFDIYKVENINEPIKNYRPYHVQIPEDNRYHSLYNMPDDFSHDDKILAFSKIVERNCNLIGQCFFEYTKNKKYNIKILKGINY